MASLRDKLQAASAPAAAPVAEKEVVPPARGGGVKKTKDIVVEALAEQYSGEKIDAESYGKHSDKLAIVALIGDPSVTDTAEIVIDGKKERKKFSTIVGYRFRALMDMEVPDFGTTSRFNGTRLMSAANVTEWKQVKEGEVFDLTRIETATLLSKPEFGMVAAGGDIKVRLVLGFARFDLQAERTDEGLPNVALSVIPKGSIKTELEYIDVLEYTPAEDSDNPFAEGDRVLKKEFEGTKFAPRALAAAERTASRTRKGAKGSSDHKAQAIMQSQAWMAALSGISNK